MKGSWRWVGAAWLVAGCVALPMQQTGYQDPDIPRTVFRNSGSRGYEFEYKVVDSQAAWVHGRDEQSDGVSTRGSYAVKLPDGRIQRVTYTADDDGYHPVVTYLYPDGGGGEGGGGGGGRVGGGGGGRGGGGGGGRGGGGGGRRGYDLKGKSNIGLKYPSSAFGKMQDSMRLGYTAEGLGPEVMSPYYPYDLWDTMPHNLYDPERPYDDFDLYDLPRPYDYYYQPPTRPQTDHNAHLYTTPVYMPAMPDSRERMGYRNDMRVKQKMEYKESSEEQDMSQHPKMVNYAPKSAVYGKMKGKTHSGDNKKRPMSQERKSMESNSYEMMSKSYKNVKMPKMHKNDMYESNESSNEDMTEKMDAYEMKMKTDDHEEYDSGSKEMKMNTDKVKTDGYKVTHNKSAQHKDMNAYIRKIKKVLARFTKPRTPHNHPSLYRQDTTQMIIPRKYIPLKKTGTHSVEENVNFKGKPHQTGVRMTPPDKPFLMPKSHAPPPPPPPSSSSTTIRKHSLIKRPHTGQIKPTFHTSTRMTPPDKPFLMPKNHHPPPPPSSTATRKHSLNKRPHTGQIEPTFHTSAPMLHAPPPPPPHSSPRKPIIRLMPPHPRPHHPSH